MDPFQQAIVALLTGQNVVEANNFLIAFTDSDEAWLASIRCIEGSNDFAVKYFAANILYTKVRKHWSQLAENGRTQVYASLANMLMTGGIDDVEFHDTKKVRCSHHPRYLYSILTCDPLFPLLLYMAYIV